MSTTNSVNQQTVSQSLLDSVNKKSKSQSSEISDIQNRFITLLVTQMKNQDPLNPMDNAAVTSQFAQLSMVGSLEKMNTNFQQMTESNSATQVLQAANLIGRNVLVAGNEIQVNQGDGAFAINLENPADQVKIQITDQYGNLVNERQLNQVDSGTTVLTWNALNQQGQRLPDGTYRVSVSATKGQNTVNASALSYQTVNSVSSDKTAVGVISLDLQNQKSVRLSEVYQIV